MKSANDKQDAALNGSRFKESLSCMRDVSACANEEASPFEFSARDTALCGRPHSAAFC